MWWHWETKIFLYIHSILYCYYRYIKQQSGYAQNGCRSPQSAVHSPQSTVHSPQSTVRSPQFPPLQNAQPAPRCKSRYPSGRHGTRLIRNQERRPCMDGGRRSTERSVAVRSLHSCQWPYLRAALHPNHAHDLHPGSRQASCNVSCLTVKREAHRTF
jgi:hypothetical protein